MITITSSEINDIISYVSSTFVDLMPIILFIGGVITGLYILNSLLNKGERDHKEN